MLSNDIICCASDLSSAANELICGVTNLSWVFLLTNSLTFQLDAIIHIRRLCYRKWKCCFMQIVTYLPLVLSDLLHSTQVFACTTALHHHTAPCNAPCSAPCNAPCNAQVCVCCCTAIIESNSHYKNFVVTLSSFVIYFKKPPSLAESVSNKLLHPSFHFPDQTEYDGLAKASSFVISLELNLDCLKRTFKQLGCVYFYGVKVRSLRLSIKRTSYLLACISVELLKILQPFRSMNGSVIILCWSTNCDMRLQVFNKQCHW